MGTFVTPDGQRYNMPGIDDPSSASEAIKTHPVLKGTLPEGTKFVAGESDTGPSSGFGENVLRSGAKFVSDVVTPFTKPIETIDSINKIGAGILSKVVGGSLYDPDAEESANAVGQYYVNKYGSIDNLKKTMYEDPVGFMADVSTVLTMGGGLASKAGSISKSSSLLKAGEALSTASDVANPLAAPGLLLKGARKTVAATNIPEDIYARTMKMPPGSVREDVQGKVLKTLVRNEEIPLGTGRFSGKSSLEKINNIVKKTGDSIDKELGWLQSQYASEIDVGYVTNALDKFKDKYKKQLDYKAYEAAIDDVKDMVVQHAYSNNGKIGVFDANEMKKGIHQSIESYYMKQQKPESGRVGVKNDVDASARAEAAKALRASVLDHPDVPASVRENLERQAGAMNARKWVERATNRGGNLDPVSLSGMLFGVLVDNGMPAAAAWRVSTSQPVMSRLALQLAHGNKTMQSLGKTVRPGALGSRLVGEQVNLLSDR